MSRAGSAPPAGFSSAASPWAVLAAWPRSVQTAAGYLLGLATALVAYQIHSSGAWGARPSELQSPARAGYAIDVNQANSAELLQLPGVGPNLAGRIEAERIEHGAYQAVDDLRRVRGIGPAALERLRPWVEAKASLPNPATAQPRLSSKSGKTSKLTGPIDINSATAVELQLLPRVGAKRAQLIIEAREQQPFASVDDLRRVSGIGPKTLEMLRPLVTVGPAAEHVAARP